MDLKNYQEDLVLYVADRVLRDRPDVRPNQVMLHDVAAYALNRLPPRYVQSERGFTRFAAEQWVENGNAEGLAGLMEVLLLVNRGVDVVKGRRRAQPSAAGGRRRRAEAPVLEPGAYWHNLPYIIGRVRDAAGKAVLEARVEIRLNRELAVPVDAGWPNPMRTSAATKGFFSFLPRPLLSSSKTRRLRLEVLVEHPEFEPQTQCRTLNTHGELVTYQYIQPDRILDLGQISLQRLAKRG